MTDETGAAIAVVGSVSLEVFVPVAELPAPGQTVLGGGQSRQRGGKGAIQAIAAARVGGSVAMVGRVGADESGPKLIEGLAAEGVQTAHVLETASVPTGRALIAVNPAGERTVIITPGANGRLTSEDCEAAKDVLAGARVTLLQREVSHEANDTAAQLSGGFVVVNPAPVRVGENRLPARVDVLVANRRDLAALVGLLPAALDDPQEAAWAARKLRGVGAVVAMLGEQGVLVVQGGVSTLIKPFPVDAVDRTAAEDCFCGALCSALANGEPLERAAVFATAAAALATTRHGSQSSLPTREEVEKLVATRR